MKRDKSAKPNKNQKILVITLAGLLIAVDIVLERYLVIEVSNSSRYSLAFSARAVSGAVLGPLVSGITGGLSDFIGAVLKFGSPIFPLCFTAVLRGALYGIFLYKKCTVNRIVFCTLSVELGCSMLLNSIVLYSYYGTPLEVLLLTRGLQAIIMIALQIPVLILMKKYLFPQLKRILFQYKY